MTRTAKNMENNKDITAQEVNELVKMLEEETEKVLTQGPVINVIDLSLAYNHLFSRASKRAMSHKVTSLIHQRTLKHIVDLKAVVLDKVEYFSVIVVGEENLIKGAEKIAALINSYSERGYVTGCLAPLSALSLISEPHEFEKWAVFCFVSFTEEGSKVLAKENPAILTKEGEISAVEIR